MITPSEVCEEGYEELKYYNFRLMIIEGLSQLSDFEYQKKEWLSGPYYYDGEFGNIWSFLLDDCDYFPHAVEKKDITLAYYSTGTYMWNKEEAEKVYDFCLFLEEMSDTIGQRVINEEYLNSPYLPIMLEKAKELLSLLLKNEKGNDLLFTYLKQYKKDKGINIDLKN